MTPAYNKITIPQAMPSYDCGNITAVPVIQNHQASIDLVARQALSTQTTRIDPKNQRVPHAFAHLCSLSMQKLEQAHLEKYLVKIINILQPELDAIYPLSLLKLTHALAKIEKKNSAAAENFIAALYRTLCKHLKDFNAEDLIATSESMIELNVLPAGFIEYWSKEIMLRLNLNGRQLSRCYTVLDFLEKCKAASPRYPVDFIRQQLTENLFRAPLTS